MPGEYLSGWNPEFETDKPLVLRFDDNLPFHVLDGLALRYGKDRQGHPDIVVVFPKVPSLVIGEGDETYSERPDVNENALVEKGIGLDNRQKGQVIAHVGNKGYRITLVDFNSRLAVVRIGSDLPIGNVQRARDINSVTNILSNRAKGPWERRGRW